MKRTHCITIITSLFFILNSLTLAAQAPQRMSYQSIIRNTAGELVSSTTVGVKVSILKDSQDGTAVYEETFTGATNENGLLTLEIGGGTPLSGTFTAINWSSGIYFVKTETDPTGGSNYSITATGQLLSVPYAFYSSSSSNQGKTTIILTGDITDAEAAVQLSRELGPNTENIVINGTTQLTTSNFNGLTNLVSIEITENQALTQVSFGTLTKVLRQVDIEGNPSLTGIAFPVLKNVYGTMLFIYRNSNLTSLDLSSLENISKGDLSIVENSNLQQLNLNTLKKAQNIYIAHNVNLNSIGMPQLIKCAQAFAIKENPLLTNLNCNAFVETTGISISDNPALTTINFPQGSALININISDCSGLQSIAMPLVNATNITFENVIGLTNVNLNSFVTGSLTFKNTGLTTFSFPNLHSPENVILDRNTQLTSVDFSMIQTLRNYVAVRQNPILTSIILPEALTITEPDSYATIYFTNNSLTSAAINSILHKLLTITPLSNLTYRLEGQTPAAPPTGQGLLDKQTLLDRPNTVITD